MSGLNLTCAGSGSQLAAIHVKWVEDLWLLPSEQGLLWRTLPQITPPNWQPGREVNEHGCWVTFHCCEQVTNPQKPIWILSSKTCVRVKILLLRSCLLPPPPSPPPQANCYWCDGDHAGNLHLWSQGESTSLCMTANWNPSGAKGWSLNTHSWQHLGPNLPGNKHLEATDTSEPRLKMSWLYREAVACRQRAGRARVKCKRWSSNHCVGWSRKAGGAAARSLPASTRVGCQQPHAGMLQGAFLGDIQNGFE